MKKKSDDLIYFIDSNGSFFGGYSCKSLGINDIHPNLADRIFFRLMNIHYGSQG